MGSISGAAASEDRLVFLRALRGRLSLDLDCAKSLRDVETLARRLQFLAAEIDEIAAYREPIGAADEICRRREQRRRKGVPGAIDHSAIRGDKLHAEA